MPGALGIVVPWVFSFMICVLLAGRTLSLLRLGISVAVSQFLFHTLFVLGTVTPSGVSVRHVHGAPLVIPASAGVPEAVTADASMWLGHALAALLTIAALYRGERLILAARDLAAQLGRWLRRRVDHVLVLPALRLPEASAACSSSRVPVASFSSRLSEAALLPLRSDLIRALGFHRSCGASPPCAFRRARVLNACMHVAHATSDERPFPCPLSAGLRLGWRWRRSRPSRSPRPRPPTIN